MSTLTISLIQPDLFWEDKEANLSMLEKKIRGINETPEIIVLPEMFSTGFSMRPEDLAETMDGTAVQWMRQMAAVKKTIITGSLIIRNEEKYYNRLIWMLPNGSMGIYDKRHLFAFADEHRHYSPGNKRLIASVNGWKINLQTCYDLRFPVWIRQSGRKEGEEPAAEFDLLIVTANWPQKRIHAWRTLLQARAIENQCYTIGLNRSGRDGNGIEYSGESMVIDAMGKILHEMPATESVYTCRIEKEALLEVRSRFPFWRDADDFNILP
jgi:omega-amidase